MKTSLGLTIVSYMAILFAIATPSTIILSQETTTRRPSFEVASIKPSNSGGVSSIPVHSGDYLAYRGVPLKLLISIAYRLPKWQIQGKPGWIDSQLWDVEAKGAENSISRAPKPRDINTPDLTALMLQSLLEDRFQLRIERKTMLSPVYNLVVVKGGPKIKLDEDQSPPAPSEPGIPGARSSGELRRGGISLRTNSIEGRAITIKDFIMTLLFRTDRPIIDRTSLSGRYNIRVKWSPETLETESPTSPSLPIAARSMLGFDPAFFTALKEQLGLQLESAKGRVDFLVITSVQKPSEN